MGKGRIPFCKCLAHSSGSSPAEKMNFVTFSRILGDYAMTDDLEPIREIRMNPIVPSESILVAAARSMRPREAEAPAPRDTRDHVETCPLLPRQRGQDPADPARLPRGGRLGGAHR